LKHALVWKTFYGPICRKRKKPQTLQGVGPSRANDMRRNTGLTIKCMNCGTLVSKRPDGSFPFHTCPLPKNWLAWAEDITSLDDNTNTTDDDRGTVMLEPTGTRHRPTTERLCATWKARSVM